MATTVAPAPEVPEPPRAHVGAPLAVVLVREETLRQRRLVVSVYGADSLQVRNVCRLLATRFPDGGRVFRLRRSRMVREWSLPATDAYAEALHATLAGEGWIRVVWHDEGRGAVT